MSAGKIFGKPRDEILGDIGYALQQVRRTRGLTSDDMRVVFGLKDDDMVAKYIAGDNAMSVVVAPGAGGVARAARADRGKRHGAGTEGPPARIAPSRSSAGSEGRMTGQVT
jgi:hypothetical protein